MDLIPLTTQAGLEAALTEEWAIVYKHSNRCWISSMAVRHVKRFAESHPDVPVYQVDVVEARELSNALTHALGIPHQSPQAFLVNRGRVVWHDSHSAIKEKALAQARGDV